MSRRLVLLLFLAALAVAGCATRPGPDWVARGFDDACRPDARFAPAADANRASLDGLSFAPFGAQETGWRIYAPKVAADLGVPCGPWTQRFAARLARWQRRHGLPAHGAMTPETFDRLKAVWQAARPFVAVRAAGVCPDPPPEAALDQISPGERLDEREIRVARPALAAYRRMRAAALADLAGAGDPDLLKPFSGYRSPAFDDERCAREGNCQGIVRALCSAHRTGIALDLYLGAAPGFTADASVSANRLFQTETPAYRWLVLNARRFGFVPYVFEPWHWEWIGASGGRGP